MNKTHEDGEGTVYYSKSDGCWFAQLPPDPITGKRPKRRAKNEREANKKLRAMKAEHERGVDLSVKNPTLEQFSVLWLEKTIKDKREDLTYDDYASKFRRYINPTLGRYPLNRLTTPMLQDFVNALAEGYAASTVRNTYSVLHNALKTAVLWYRLPWNVAIGVVLPPDNAAEIVPPTVKQVQTLFAVVEGHRNAALYYCYPILGLRLTEGLGLSWHDWNETNATITVSQQAQSRNGHGVKLKNPKNDSRRILPLPPHLSQRLATHQKNQQEERRLLGANWKDYGLIFASEVGTPIIARNLERQFEGLRKRAGLPHLTPHILRHFAATQLNALGVSEAARKAILGHKKSGDVTLRYTHAQMEEMRAALEQLESLVLRRKT